MSDPLPSKEMTGERLGQLRELAQQALNEPMDSSVPPHERDLVIAAQDLMWLLDHVESPLRRAVRIARGESGPPTEPVGFARETEARQAPIVHVMIKDGEAAYTLIYSPGLPDGQHDLYCEPEAIAPMMRDEPLCQMSPAAADVIAERLRQLTKEGWTPEHDNEHDMGELAEAAACYALKSAGNEESLFERWWPWSSSWWKPKGRRRDLVRAGALILAEIERLDRKTPEKARED